jgi:hypothetical protein
MNQIKHVGIDRNEVISKAINAGFSCEKMYKLRMLIQRKGSDSMFPELLKTLWNG